MNESACAVKLGKKYLRFLFAVNVEVCTVCFYKHVGCFPVKEVGAYRREICKESDGNKAIEPTTCSGL